MKGGRGWGSFRQAGGSRATLSTSPPNPHSELAARRALPQEEDERLWAPGQPQRSAPCQTKKALLNVPINY